MRVSPFIAKDWSSKVAKCHVWPKERWEMSNISQTSSCPVEFGCPKKSLLGPIFPSKSKCWPCPRMRHSPQATKPHVHNLLGFDPILGLTKVSSSAAYPPDIPISQMLQVKSAVGPPDLDSSAESTKTTFFGTKSCHDLPNGKWVGLKSGSKRKLGL